MRKTLVIFLLLSLVTVKMMAQDSLTVIPDDTLTLEETLGPDTVLLKSYAARYDPRKALLYAAVLPGLGQIYTKKYWKLPLVYGGMGLIGYHIDLYQKGYTKYKLMLYKKIDDPSSSLYSEEQLRSVVNRAQRERDFMIILMAGVYLLQIIDAHVDAHLKEFDLNPKLQVRVEPTLSNDQMIGRQAGFSILIRF